MDRQRKGWYDLQHLESVTLVVFASKREAQATGQQGQRGAVVLGGAGLLQSAEETQGEEYCTHA